MVNISPSQYFELQALHKIGCAATKIGGGWWTITLTEPDGQSYIVATQPELKDAIRQASANERVRAIASKG